MATGLQVQPDLQSHFGACMLTCYCPQDYISGTLFALFSYF